MRWWVIENVILAIALTSNSADFQMLMSVRTLKMSAPNSAITTLEVIAVSADQVTSLTLMSTPAKVMNGCDQMRF